MSRSIEWDRYALSYDLLASNNPSYQENIDLIQDLLSKLALAEGARVCDIGAGTGNFLTRIAPSYSGVRFVHLDSSAEMNEVARDKYRSHGVTNVEIVQKSIFEYDIDAGHFDVLLCINALYAMQPQRAALERMHNWLNKDGKLLIIDFGRPTRIVDWARFIIKSTFNKKGFCGVVALVTTGFGSILQNRKGAKGQDNGNYWLHSTDEFGAFLSNVGYQVERLQSCYRGYCDLAVCSKGSTPSP